jgi:hypothetical protein
MIVFDKYKIREQLSLDDVFTLLQEWGGDPEYSSFGILCATICHNPPGEGSKKLYYYSNTGLFRCYTGCENSTFDIFELVIKIAKIQWNKDYDLNEAIRWISLRLHLSGTYEDVDTEALEDWKILANYDRIQETEIKDKNVILKEYDDIILSRFNYTVSIDPWIKEGINKSTLKQAQIGFYPGGDQITIPHFDINGRLIGLRGRSLCSSESELYGKYRPLKINNQLYNHPLGFNLYNLNNSKENINLLSKAIVFESEKSALKYASYFGIENDISVACCGFNLSLYQVELLLNNNAKEIVIAFDRDFSEKGDEVFKKQVKYLKSLHKRYHNDVLISFIFDKHMKLLTKDSPIDRGKELFLELFKERIIL